MEAVAAKKIVAVLIMKAVLLGMPVGDGDRIPDYGWSMAGWEYVGSASGDVRVRGEQILTDTGAGLTVVFGPEERFLRVLFLDRGDAGSHGGYGRPAFGRGSPDVQEVVLELGKGYDFDLLEVRISGYEGHTTRESPWPDGYISFPFPRDGSAYFLEQVEEDLYRRVELAATEGYAIDARLRALDPTVEVQLDLMKRVLLGGKYEDTIRAWVGKPRLVKTSVGSTVPIEPGERVLLIWHSPLEPRAEAAGLTGEAAGPPPEWAVGKWIVDVPREEVMLIVQPDGLGALGFSVTPTVVHVDASGNLSSGPDAALEIEGTLTPDGLGHGKVTEVRPGPEGEKAHTSQWTATKVQTQSGADDQAAATSPVPIRLAQLQLETSDRAQFSFGESYGGPRFAAGQMRPMGLAVLLELRQWTFEPAPAELRREFEPLAKALRQATGDRAKLDLQHTQTPTIADLPEGVTPPEHGYLTVVPIAWEGQPPGIAVGDQQFAPLMAVRVADDATVELYGSLRATGSEAIAEQYVEQYVRQKIEPGAYLACSAPWPDGTGVTLVGVADDAALRPVGEREGPARDEHVQLELPPAGAPELPFAVDRRWSGLRQGRWFTVYGPAGAGEPRPCMQVAVAEEQAPRYYSSYGRGAESEFYRGFGRAEPTEAGERRLNMHVRSMPLGDVLRMVSRASGINLIVSPEVDEELEIDAELKDMSALEALEAILAPHGLEAVRQDGSYLVRKRQ